MDYLVTFLEGIVTFVSPCLLPLVPVYLAYFAGSENGGEDGINDGRGLARTVVHSCLFVLGFTVVFVAMGALSGTFGSLLVRYRTTLNLVCGGYVVLLGLGYLGVLRVPALSSSGALMQSARSVPFRALRTFLLGLAFAVAWTPCVGTFLSAALSLAASSASAWQGISLLLCYSAGLGLPFVLCAVLMRQVTGAFDVLRRNYEVVNRVCGILLVAVGVFMMLGFQG